MNRHSRSPLLLWALTLVLSIGMVACGSEETAETGEETGAAEEMQGTDGADDMGQDAAQNTPDPAQPSFDPNQELAASHVLIMYQGSQQAGPEITRTKKEALAMAQDVAERARGGADFAELAAQESEGPTAARGGNLGVFQAGQMIPEFSAAALELEVGEISDPVETAFGYHVIQRNEIEQISARHVLIMHTESQRVPPNITRSREEAMARADSVLARAQAGEDFATLAQEYSDGPTNVRGGDLGSFGKGAMVPEFENAAFALEVGGVSGVVETPFGFHVIKRYE